jgi:hypothetical protein
MLQPVYELDTPEFWQQNEGLALFVSFDQGLRYYRLPIEFEELVVVSDRFHIKPLLPLATGDQHFYILALSQKRVGLLRGSPYSVKGIDLEKLESVPKSLDEALQYDEPDEEIQNRISTPRGGTANSFQQAGTFHGQGSPDTDDIKQDILQYFQQIDHGLYELFRGRKAPLVLAAVEYLLPIYREANTYPHLLEEGITGSPDGLTPEELRQQAWEIVQPYLQQAQQQAIERYQELAVAGQASNKLEEVVSAAYYQRVDCLFVAVGVQQWGLFNPSDGSVQLHSEEETGDEDLLDLAATHTFLNGGTVYAVEPEAVPGGSSIAAIFRY